MVRADVQALLEAPRAVPQRRHGEPHCPPRPKHRRRGGPAEPEPAADGVSHDAAFEFDPVGARQQVRPPRRIHRQPVRARLVALRHTQRRQRRAVRRTRDRQEQVLITHHTVEHHVGLEEIDPRHGLKQLALTDRTTGVCASAAPIGLVDPNGRLGEVLRFDEPRRSRPGHATDQGGRQDQPLESRDRVQHASPVQLSLVIGETRFHERKRRRLGDRSQARRRRKRGERRTLFAGRHNCSAPMRSHRFRDADGPQQVRYRAPAHRSTGRGGPHAANRCRSAASLDAGWCGPGAFGAAARSRQRGPNPA